MSNISGPPDDELQRRLAAAGDYETSVSGQSDTGSVSTDFELRAAIARAYDGVAAVGRAYVELNDTGACGFSDLCWSLGQTLIWIVSYDAEAVGAASNDSGRLGVELGQARAAAVIERLKPLREWLLRAGNDLRLACLESRLTAYDRHDHPIPAMRWRHWTIVLDTQNMPWITHEGQGALAPDVVFRRDEILDLWPPLDVEPVHESKVWEHRVCERRKHVANWFIRRQERTAPEKRVWFCLPEIADEFARKPGAFAVDDEERTATLEALRRSILAREFSCVLNTHPSELANFRFDPDGAAIPELFNKTVGHLWIRYQDCVAWSNRHGLELPHRLRREAVSPCPPMIVVGEAINGGVNLYASGITQVDADYDERTGDVLRSWPMVEALNPDKTRDEAAAIAPIELRTATKKSEPVKRSVEEKRANAINIAQTFVIDGVAPNCKHHTTSVKRELDAGPVEYRMRRDDVEALIKTVFAAARRKQGNPHSKRS